MKQASFFGLQRLKQHSTSLEQATSTLFQTLYQKDVVDYKDVSVILRRSPSSSLILMLKHSSEIYKYFPPEITKRHIGTFC